MRLPCTSEESKAAREGKKAALAAMIRDATGIDDLLKARREAILAQQAAKLAAC